MENALVLTVRVRKIVWPGTGPEPLKQKAQSFYVLLS